MTLAAKSPSSCSSGSSDEIEKQLKEEIEKEIEEEIEQEIEEEIEEETKLAEQRNKRISATDESSDEETVVETVEVAKRENISDAGGNVKCSHLFVARDICLYCHEVVGELGESSVTFNYNHKDLRLEPSKIEKLRKEYMKDLLKKKKLILVLGLDDTLLNSALVDCLTLNEEHLLDQLDEGEDVNHTLFKLDKFDMLTKLRPFVHTFLKEANQMFEMCIYTTGERDYAMELAKLLDPEGVYFSSRVICQSDNTTINQKGFDVFLGSENHMIILDDTEQVWQKHMENLILMKRYNYFANGLRQYDTDIKSLAVKFTDESESDGILASILNVLKQAHDLFFDPVSDFATRDVRQILQLIKMEILHDCDIVFSNVLSSSVWPEEPPLWKFAEAMGARCFAALNDSVTHVIAKVPPTTRAVKWARVNNKFVVTPQWIEEANYLWKRQKEEDFLVPDDVMY